MKLSETDRMILKSYDAVLDGFAKYLGEGCEIVLHSMEDLNNSVIKIVNGHHTGRKVGAPITDFGLGLLKEIDENEGKTSLAYFTRNNKGEPMKSLSIAILGEKGRVIGLLCVNYYLNMPISDFMSIFSGESMDNKAEQETFSENSSDLVENAVIKAKREVSFDQTISSSLKNREIIRILSNQGIFNIKNAVEHTAELLGISKNTVYMHLRYLKKEKNI